MNFGIVKVEKLDADQAAAAREHLRVTLRQPADSADDRLRRLYLAGPMTGLADHNYPAFHAAAAYYRAQGYHVENPAENTIEPDADGSVDWPSCMRLSIRRMLLCDVVAALDGWEKSRGAFLELHLARLLSIPCHADCDLRKSFQSADAAGGADQSDLSDKSAGGAV